MKHFTFLRPMLLLCALIVGVGSSWAADETITFSSLSLTNGIQYTSFKGTDYNVNFDIAFGDGGNDGKYYNTGSAIRVYGGGHMTVSSTKTISKIELTFGSGEGSNTITTDAETYSNGTWTGEATSVTFTVGGASGHRRIACVAVTYKNIDPSKQNVTLAFPEESYDADINDDFTAPTLTNQSQVAVTYSSSKESVATVNETTGVVTLVGIGTTVITATFEGNETYNSAEASYTLKVTDRNANDGSAEKPYTIAEARTAIDAGEGVTGVYVKGIVSEIVTAYNSQFGNISYNISADGLTTSDQLQAYRGKSYNGDNFTSEDDIQVGDVVVVYGNLKKYNEIYEFDQNNQLVSLKRSQKADADLSYETTEFTVNIGEVNNFTAPTLSNPNKLTVTYSSSDENLALVDENTGDVSLEAKEGTVTITASFAGNDDFKAGNASYTITIKDPDKKEKGTAENPFTVAEVNNETATGNGVYVEGYIVGEFLGKAQGIKTTGITTNSNFAISDTKGDTSGETTIAIQLPKGDIRNAWNLVDNNYIGMKVIVKGEITGYFTNKTGVKNTSEVIAISAPATVTEAGWATWVAPFNVEVPSGVEAYYVTEATTSAKLTEVIAIPAGEPVLLKNEGSFDFTVCDDATIKAAELPATNLLQVSTEETANGVYVLANGGNGVGFYTWAGGQLGAGRVYLPNNAEGARDFLAFSFGEATAIKAVENAKQQGNAVYNLAGQRVAQPTRGLYIVNGKKVVLK